MQSTLAASQAEPSSEKPARLNYLDWLRVLAILGVFLFHAVHPFDHLDWHIKNAEPSLVVTLFIIFLGPWGMPLFFLMSGTASGLALRRRTNRQYINERVKRLLIPFVIGSILLTPIMAYFELTHKGWWKGGSIIEFILSPEARTYFYTDFHRIEIDPQLFGGLGYHLWFIGFLFTYSLIALPVFRWLTGDAGRRLVSGLAGLIEKRGGLFLFIVPLALVQLILRPIYPGEHDWTEFIYMLVFFLSGYVLYADRRLVQAIQRDWLLMLGAGVLSTLFFFAIAAAGVAPEWMSIPGTLEFQISWIMFSVSGWCWTIFMLYVGMRLLEFRNKWLEYWQEAILPFFLVHQPVIMAIAFYVVQWDADILVKLPVVVVGSFVVSLGVYEVFVRRIPVVRGLFGMKTRPQEMTPAKAA